MTDNPATSSGSEPADIDIAAELELFEERISLAVREQHLIGMDPVQAALVNAVKRLFEILEHETRRIDNELTQAVTDRDSA